MTLWKKFGKLLRLRKKSAKAISIHNVAIFGYADAKPGDELFNSTKEVAKGLARLGYTVVDGGGPGVMRAATIGAKQGGGKVLAVTLNLADMTNFEGRDPDNVFDKEIKTDSYVERTLTLMKAGQVYVVFNGGTGTISEFAMAWGSSGKVGFKGSKKSTPYAGQKTMEDVLARVKDRGMVEADVFVTGVGSGRESAIRALQGSGMSILSIKDRTPIPHGGVRSKKVRRV
jgi:small subunit ribosomal protein S11